MDPQGSSAEILHRAERDGTKCEPGRRSCAQPLDIPGGKCIAEGGLIEEDDGATFAGNISRLKHSGFRGFLDEFAVLAELDPVQHPCRPGRIRHTKCFADLSSRPSNLET